MLSLSRYFTTASTKALFSLKNCGRYKFFSFKRLLIKIYAAYPVLKIVVDVGRNINYKVITAHIAEQAHKTTLIKLYKLFGKPNYVGV